MALVKLSANERRRLSAFFNILVLASFAWLFNNLTGSVKIGVYIVLKYKNAPQKRAFHALQSDTVTTMLQGSGWQMLFQKMNAPVKVINVDLHTLENKDYVVLSSQLKQLNDEKEFDQQIVSFSPDTLYFDFSDRATKKVPVKLVTDIKYQRQFAQSNDITLNPSYITISGPGNAIDKIKSWNTDSLILDSVSQTVKTSVTLQPVKEGNLSIYPKTVQVKVPVDEFTEKTIQVPVKLVNNHGFYNVKIFPQKVKITFTTSLNKYPEMDEDFLKLPQTWIFGATAITVHYR